MANKNEKKNLAELTFDTAMNGVSEVFRLVWVQ